MNHALIDKIARAVLYEGYILYPYRPSTKNSQRWTFGGLYPQAYSETFGTGDAWALSTEFIVLGGEATTIEATVRFLHLMDRQVGKVVAPVNVWPKLAPPAIQFVDCASIGNKKYQRWQEATERESPFGPVTIERLLNGGLKQDFDFPASETRELVNDADGQVAVVLDRTQRAVSGSLEVSASRQREGVFKVSIQVRNTTPFDGKQENGDVRKPAPRDAALLLALVSTHLALGVSDGQFVSLTDPPDALKDVVAGCKNAGVWPVLVGDPGDMTAMLASPIILYDYPQIAPESPGDLFDGGEIDEILTLRIMTLTDEEKRDVSAIDERADAMLKRTESLAREQLMNLHGSLRGVDSFPPADVLPDWDAMSDRPKLPVVRTGGMELHPGDRVRLRPRGGADAFDLVLSGKIATIAVIEQDYEDRIHLAVTIEDDPGADFGVAGKPGHRFFFRPDEVEPVGLE